MPTLRASLSRRTQPQRKQLGREPSMALTASQRGRTAAGFNPQDAKRAATVARKKKAPVLRVLIAQRRKRQAVA